MLWANVFSSLQVCIKAVSRATGSRSPACVGTTIGAPELRCRLELEGVAQRALMANCKGSKANSAGLYTCQIPSRSKSGE